MKRKLLTLKALIILGAFLCANQVKAQDDVGALFKSGPADASKLVGAYMNPLLKGFGVGLNSSWNNSAKSLGTLKFNLQVTVSGAFVPTEDQSYNTNTLGLQNIRPVSGQNGIGPTAFGADQEGSKMEFYSGGVSSGSFNLPKGLGFHTVPSPQIQLTVGLPKNIDVQLRVVPEVKVSNDIGKVSMFGIGAKIEVLPLLLGKTEKLVPFDLAIGAGFSRLNYTLPLEGKISSGGSNQELALQFNGFNIEAIISKKITFFSPFASVGYSNSASNLKALGTYVFDVPVTPTTPTGKQTYTNPIDINPADVNSLKATLGFQLKFGFFRFYTSYTAATYSFVNAGIGLGIGK